MTRKIILTKIKAYIIVSFDFEWDPKLRFFQNASYITLTMSSAGFIHAIILTSILLFINYSIVQARFSAKLIDPVGNVPPARADHASFVINTQDGYFLIVHGGRNSEGALNDTWTYSVNQNNWEVLSPMELNLDNDPPPAMYGATSGYRYVEGFLEPFFYITLGTADGKTSFFNEMWCMEFRNFTWKKVKLDGEIPSPRFGSSGGLEMHAKKDGSTQAEIIVTHGFGPEGLLSDAYRCILDYKDPYKATWRKIHDPISQYSLFKPHPVSNQASTFTAKRDIIMFGGCYSSQKFGGYCPSNAAWQFNRGYGEQKFEASEEDDGYEYTWSRLSSEPAVRTGAAMSQALSSFEGSYESWAEIAVLFSGVNQGNSFNSSQLLSYDRINNLEISLYSTKSEKWIREKVELIGDKSAAQIAKGRSGSSLDISFDTKIAIQDVPNEFYLFYGGQMEDGSFADSILKISFDPYALSNAIPGSAKYWSRPQVHGILMFVAFGILTPIAAFILRYLREKRRLFILHTAHIAIKLVVIAISWTGYVIVRHGRKRKFSNFVHGTIGYMILILISVQPVFTVISGAIRIRRRKRNTSISGESVPSVWRFSLWKWFYRMTGLVILILGLTNVTLGVFVLTSPLLLWVHWLVYIIVIAIIAFWMELTISPIPDQGGKYSDRSSLGGRSSPPASLFAPEGINPPAPVHRRHRSRHFTPVRYMFGNTNRGKNSQASQALSGSSVPYFT